MRNLTVNVLSTSILSYFLINILTALSTFSVPTYDTIFNESQKNFEFLTNVRRTIHKHPEIAFTEVQTSKYIKSILNELKINYTEGWGINHAGPDIGGTGIVAEIGTGQPPCVALRADIDALFIQEMVDSSFKSERPGYMHACGHDAHATMLIGAAKVLKQYEDQIEGTVRLIFQPAEENDAGAIILVEEGVLTKYPPVERIFGFHIDPKTPTGGVVCYPGIFWGGVSGFVATITGKGGHAARHHLTRDPIAAGMAFVRSLFDLHARELYYQYENAGGISITYIKTNNFTANNILSDSITIGGSLRSIETSTMLMLRKRIFEIGQKIAESYQCTIEFWPEPRDIYVPTLYNDPELFKFYEKVVSEGARDGHLITTEPEFTSEDFAFYAQKVPAVFALIGIGSGHEIPDHPPTNLALHNSKLSVDERVLPIGASLYAHLGFQSIVDMNNNKINKSTSNVKDEL